MRGVIAILFGLCALSSAQVAAVTDSTKPVLLRELMERTGLNAQIHQFPEIIKSGVEMAIFDSGGDYEAAAAITEIIEHEIEPERVIDDVGAQLSQDLSETDLRVLLDWLDSPLGRKITRLESAAPSPDLDGETTASSGVDGVPAINRDRAQLYSRLDQAIRATEATVEMTLNAQIAVASAIVSASADPDAPSTMRIREKIEAQRFQLRGLVTHQVHTSFVHTYQALSIAELESYIRQASTPSGRRYTAAVIRALNQSLTASFERVGARMGTELLS